MLFQYFLSNILKLIFLWLTPDVIAYSAIYEKNLILSHVAILYLLPKKHDLSRFSVFYKRIVVLWRLQKHMLARHGFTRKRNTKRLKHTGNLFKKILQLKGVC